MSPVEVLNKLNESDELKKTLINDVKTDLNIEPGSDEEEALESIYDVEDEEKKFEDYVLDDFVEFIEYKYDCISSKATEEQLNKVTEDDINEYMSSKFYEVDPDADGADDLNKAEDFLRSHFGLEDKLEEDFNVFHATPEEIDDYYSNQYYEKTQKENDQEKKFKNACYTAASQWMSGVNEETSKDFIERMILPVAKNAYNSQNHSDEDYLNEIIFNIENERGIKFDFNK